jgi:hypothetical protein
MGIVVEGGIDIGPGITISGTGNPVGYIDIFGNNFSNPSTTISQQNTLVYDSSDNLYIAGYIDSDDNNTGIVAKYNVSGTLQWQRTLGATSPSSTYFLGIDLDNSNNVYVVGGTSSDGTIDGTDVQIAKYDTNGNLQWQKTLGSAGLYQAGVSIVVEQSTGDFYVGGYSLPNGGFPQNDAMLLVKYNSSGVLQWQKSLTYAGDSASCSDIALDSTGNIYIAGTSTTTATYGQGALIKYNSSGAVQWQVAINKATGQSGYDGITIDSSDNIFVCGTALTGVGGNSYGIVAKYDTSGTLQWKKQIGNPEFPVLTGITVDSSGNIYTTGWGGPNFSSYIIKLDTTGNLVWQRQLTATDHWAHFYSITIDSSDKLLIGGYSKPTSGSNNQILMFNVPNDGAPTGTYTASGISVTYSIPTMTQADLSAWSTTTTTLTAGTPSFTAATSSLTGATSSFTNTVTLIP